MRTRAISTLVLLVGSPALAQVSPSAPFAPAAVVAPAPRPAAPLADRLLLPTYTWDIAGSHLTILRGSGQGPGLLNDSGTADGLALQLAPSVRGAALARQAHGELSWGRGLWYAGLLGVLVGVVGITLGAAQVTDSGAQAGLGTAGGIFALAGVCSAVIGSIALNNGLAHALEAVDAYNLELVRASGL